MGTGVRPGLLVTLLLGAGVVLVPVPAAGFGTVEGGGQHREHERITRAAVACAADGSPERDCFEARSADQLAGHGKGFGAVGAPDRTEVSVPAAHCDDADFLAGDYPQTRDDATGRLVDCVEHLRGRFREAVERAGELLDEQGRVVAAEVDLGVDCELDAAREQRAKCTTLESFGRALHGVQDFYSHSSWADEADPARPIGPDNPGGLNLPAPSAVLDLSGTDVPSVPGDLSTGCFVVPDSAPGVGRCGRRVTHAALNKDNGLIDPVTGAATSPGTPRGRVGQNFQKAVTGAIVETRHQWQDLGEALRSEYGTRKASIMTCALTHDDPAGDCNGPGRTIAALSAAGLALILVLGAVWFHRRRRARR
ncbi:CinY protein [Actinoplanes sp. GCM10030250]|uniref:CinY protein n=1 Tax=Actinoplanes sp. GCM10030250 TaxID=3273376 RepID=UPI00361D4BEF